MKIFLGVGQSQEWTHSQFSWSFLAAVTNAGYPSQVMRGDQSWDEVRNNNMIDQFLQSDCDIFVKCDADQVYPVDYFRVMVPLTEKYSVIGPVIFDRAPKNGFLSLACTDKNDVLGSNVDLLNMRGIHEIPYTHANNFYAREVFENVKPPWFERELSEDGTHYANHVDYDFLDKIKDAGYRIMANCDVVVGHLVYIPLTRENVVKLRDKRATVINAS